MAKIENGWFFEINDLWPGQAMSLEVEEVLCQHKSKFQDILMFKSKTYGNVFVLDGIIQTTDRDEFTYHEMISFLPLNSHPHPKKVLVIGAGDGGVIREVVKHPLVESVVQCEIDEDVIELSKQHLPNLASGYSSPKYTLHIGCGKEFMQHHQEEFDVIITDSTDPTGIAATLFEKEYFELIKSALKPDGVMCSQGDSFWLDLPLINSMAEACKPLFPVVKHAYTNIPMYPGGQIVFLLCSRNSETRFEQPVTKFTQEQITSFNFKFYNTGMHTAAFGVPQFYEKMSKEALKNYTDKANPDYSHEGKTWFHEKLQNAPGQSLTLVMDEILFQETTKYHEIIVFKNVVQGNVMVLDGAVQCTEKDHYAFEETIANLPLNCHPHPEKVLVIGGGSGGVVLEVSKHPLVETIVQNEIDEVVVKVSKKYFPCLSGIYGSSKLQNLHIGDYREYLKNHQHEFDVIITVPTEAYLKPGYCNLLKNSLKENGIVICQVPSFWLELDNINQFIKQNKNLFPTVKMAFTCLPSFPNGQASFVLCSLNHATNFETPLPMLSNDHLNQLEYYNPNVHRASFALPEFVNKVVKTL